MFASEKLSLSLIVEHNIVWHRVPLWFTGVNCPKCITSWSLAHPSLLTAEQREKQIHNKPINPKYSTMWPAMKKFNSFPVHIQICDENGVENEFQVTIWQYFYIHSFSWPDTQCKAIKAATFLVLSLSYMSMTKHRRRDCTSPYSLMIPYILEIIIFFIF